jgi:hypothetical protein
MKPTKATVLYAPTPHDYIVVGEGAQVYPIDHTSLLVTNTCLANTTKVLLKNDDGSFETLNSIYKPVESV